MNGNYGINDLSCQKKSMALHTKKISALLNNNTLIKKNGGNNYREHIIYVQEQQYREKKDTYVFKTQNHNHSI